MGIRLLLVGGSIALLLMIVRRRSLLATRVAGVLLFAAVVVCILFPELTTLIANELGVGRGADLVTYTSFLLFTYLFFITLGKVRRLRRDMTTLTRTIAIANVHRPPAQQDDARKDHPSG